MHRKQDTHIRSNTQLQNNYTLYRHFHSIPMNLRLQAWEAAGPTMHDQQILRNNILCNYNCRQQVVSLDHWGSASTSTCFGLEYISLDRNKYFHSYQHLHKLELSLQRRDMCSRCHRRPDTCYWVECCHNSPEVC